MQYLINKFKIWTLIDQYLYNQYKICGLDSSKKLSIG